MKKILTVSFFIITFAITIFASITVSNSPGNCSGAWSGCLNASADDSSLAKTVITTANKTGLWSGYGFNISSGNQITNVTIRADFFASNAGGFASVRVSGDNGVSYGIPHQIGGNTAEQTYFIDVTNDLYPPFWTPENLSNLLIFVTCFKYNVSKTTCNLDWLPVNVTINDTSPFASPSATPSYGYVILNTSFNSNFTGGNPPFTYYWDFKDGTDSTEQNPRHNFTTTGVFNVSFTVIDSDDDSYINIVSVTVGNFSFDRDPPNRTVNAGDNATITAIAMHLEGIPSLVTFSYQGCPPFSSCSFNPASGIASVTTSFTVDTNTTTPIGTYQMNLTGTGNGNSQTAPFTVIVV
ncbi:PKD domain-containing protein [Candidatus Woesearchaeota archaeon]|nr:PKD domain-containing protein [Candidatus Woesearchaeota archaeon]